MEDFLIKAILIGISIAIIGGVLGCFIVWKKMAYFGDSLAHSAILGVFLAILFDINLHFGVLFICVFFIIALLYLEHQHILATDTILGILAHIGLSIAIIGISLFPEHNIDLHSLLFGDILSVTYDDVLISFIASLVVLSILIYKWDNFVLMSIHKDLARSEGVPVFLYNVLFMFLVGIIVSISIQIIGVLLITSMLIIPSASSRVISTSPKMMAIISSIIGVMGVLGGISLSSLYDTPSGASVVLILSFIFASFVIFDFFKRSKS